MLCIILGFLLRISSRFAKCLFRLFLGGILKIFYRYQHFYKHLFEILALEQPRRSERCQGSDFISFIAFFARPKACAAGRGDNSRRARAMYLGLSSDCEHDNNNKLTPSSYSC